MDMLTDDLVNAAIELATPQIEAIFENPNCVWGPKLVAIVVDPPEGKPILGWVGDMDQAWNEDWPPITNFSKIAHWKATTARRHGMPTSRLVYQNPLLLMEGDYLYPGGVTDYSGKIGVGVSGIRGWADEMCANVVVAVMHGIAQLRREAIAGVKSQL